MNTVTPIIWNQPRLKVMADWPGNSSYKVGDVLVDYQSPYSNYPHLFKSLDWWEERNLDQLPGYVKNSTGEVFKVQKWKSFWQGPPFAIIGHTGLYEVKLSCMLCTPATEIDFKNQ